MGRRPNINGRELLIAAALKLFAEEGIDGVSIRAVNREAGLGPASMHYHFGTKEALVDSVLHMHGDRIVEAITTRGKELAKQDVVSARDLVTMLAQPYVDLVEELSEGGHDWIRLVSQLAQTEPERVLDPTAGKAARAAVLHAYPKVSPAQCDRALRMCFLLLVTQLAQIPARTHARSSSVDLDLLIDFLSGGLDSSLRTMDKKAAKTA
jgi:AcrR family transcriptional regulator